MDIFHFSIYCCAHVHRCLDSGGVVLAHQSNWQKHILAVYGTHMCLIDATYQTTAYDMPLFFLCVPTNVGYVNAASFLLTDERQETIALALEQIHTWNPEWSPSHFLSDFHEGQINALESVFPGSLICYAFNTETLLCCRQHLQIVVAKLCTVTCVCGWHDTNVTHKGVTQGTYLRVVFDFELTFSKHVSSVVRRCFYHMRQIRAVRKSLTTESVKTPFHALIASLLVRIF